MTAGYEDDEVYYEKEQEKKRKELERLRRQQQAEDDERFNPDVHDGYDYAKGERVGPSKSWGI